MIWELVGMVCVFLVMYGILEMIVGVRELERRSVCGSRTGGSR
jgi:hypothetical protein